MKKFSFTFFVCVISFSFSHSQNVNVLETDSFYLVKFITKETLEPIPFVKVLALENGIEKGWWSSNFDGLILIFKPTFQLNAQTKFEVRRFGYSPIQFDGDQLQFHDTLQVTMTEDYYTLNEIVITGCHIPLIDKDPEGLNRKERKILAETPYVDSSTIYSAEILATYDSIVNDGWFKYKAGNEIMIAHFDKYLYSKIHYPEHALKYGIEETIYFSLTINANGFLKDITLKKGVCPVLVIEVAAVLKRISRLVFEDSKATNAATFILPVRFVLH